MEEYKRLTLDSTMLEGDSLDKLKDWITFYRNNIHRFVEHYMGIELFFYQKIWIYLISKSTRFLGIASRASAKSWLIGVYITAVSILRPGTAVSINSMTKSQAGLIISAKIKELYDTYPNVRREIKNITTNMNKWEVEFYNGSNIKVVISGAGGRGERSNISILEERRLIPTEVIDSIIRPFLVPRIAPYMKIKEYSKLPKEEAQEVIITSAHYKSGDWYKEAIILLKRMVNGDSDVKAIFLDYLISIRHGIKTRKQLSQEKATMNSLSFEMEYENIASSGSSSSMFKSDMFTRNIKRPWIPPNIHTITKKGKNPYDIKRRTGEIRIISSDIALVGGKVNDLSIFLLMRIYPTKRGYQGEVVHIESFSGVNSSSQALRIKQLWHDFCGYENPDDRLVFDIKSAGRAVFDPLTQVTRDDERSLEYPAMTVQSDFEYIPQDTYDDLVRRTLSKDANPCVFPIVGSSERNSIFANTLRDRLKKSLLSFIVDEPILEEHFVRKGDSSFLQDSSHRVLMLGSSIQTTAMINETIALEMTILPNRGVRLTESSTARKDRYSALSYGSYYISLLDIELLKEEEETDDFTEWVNATAFV